MKKIIIALLLTAFVALLSSCSNKKDSGSVTPPPPLTNQKTTVMVYIEGSNLESEYGAASENILQMMKAPNSEFLKIVILTGAADVKHADADTTKPVKDWTMVKRSQVLEGEVKHIADIGRGCSSTIGLTENCVEMGSADTLRAFVQAASEEFPADRYILVLWDHGGGSIDGYGGAPAKSMDVEDIKNALEIANVHLEIIGFDACLMGNAEFAHNLSGHAKYLVASEELEPGNGWGYDTFLSALANNPKLTGAEIGNAIIEGFFKNNEGDDMLTLSVTDLSKVDSVVTAIDSLAAKTLEAFRTDNNTTWIQFFNARSATTEFGAMAIEKNFVNDIDISDFAAALNYYSNEKFKAQTDTLQAAVKSAVTHNKVTTTYKDSVGLSFWMPFHFDGDLSPESTTTGNLTQYEHLYGSGLAKFSDTYIKLLKEMLTYADMTPSEFSITAQQEDGFNATANITSNFGIDDVLLMRDISTDPAVVKPVISSVASFVSDGSENFKVTAESSKEVLTLESFPIYVQSNGRASMAQPNTYILSIPLFFKESAATPDDEIQQVTMLAQFDFKTGDAQIFSALLPLEGLGKDYIEMQEGNVLIIPEISIDPVEGVTITKTALEIALDANLERGIELKRGTYSVGDTENFAFAATNLKGDSEASPFFGANATPLTARGTDNFDKSKALAELLKKPLWSSKK